MSYETRPGAPGAKRYVPGAGIMPPSRGDISRAEKRERIEQREGEVRDFLTYLSTGNLTEEQQQSARMAKKRSDPLRREARDLGEGTQGVGSFTESAGALVPQEIYDQVLLGMAQFDNLFGEDDVRLSRNLEFAGLRPMRLSGWDLSTVSSAQVTEGSQESDFVPFPLVEGETLNGYMHVASIPVSFQFDQDSFQNSMALMMEAFPIALARGMGKDLVNGTGNNQPQGVLAGAANSGYTTAASTALSLTDFNSIYFSVDRAYRASPRCRWVMNDATYQLARSSVDSAGRPLIPLSDDAEKIMGKPVLISPSMPSGANTKAIVFGDLSHFFVRLSPMAIQRTNERADYGQYTFHGRMRVDSAVFDPTSGVKPPIVFATMHS